MIKVDKTQLKDGPVTYFFMWCIKNSTSFHDSLGQEREPETA